MALGGTLGRVWSGLGMMVALVVGCTFVACGEPKSAPAPPPSPSPSPTIDQAKFEPLYRSGKAIEGALGTGVSLIKFSELLQGLGTEISIAKDKATRPEERAMVSQFASALSTLVTSRQTWQEGTAEDAREIWAVALPELQAASRLYLSDAAGAKAATATAGEAMARREAEEAKAVADAEEARRASQARAVAAAEDRKKRVGRLEELAPLMFNGPTPDVRLKACLQILKLGDVASPFRSQIVQMVFDEKDEDTRDCARRLFDQIS